jgi:hypothetical protein
MAHRRPQLLQTLNRLYEQSGRAEEE